MDLLPPQVDNGLVEPPTGAVALRLTACQCPCCALKQPVKVREKQRAIIHHTSHIKYVKHGNILFKPEALHLRNTSVTCSFGVPSHMLHNRFLRLHTICSLYSACPRLPVACGLNQPSSCLTVVSDASQLFIRSSSPSSFFHLFLPSNVSVSPWQQIGITTRGLSASKPDICVMLHNSLFKWPKINQDKANFA